MTNNNEEEWIRAAEVASRIGDGCTKTLVGMYARDGFLTRDESNKTYPWPKVKAEWYDAKAQKNKRAPDIKHAQIVIHEEEATNIITTERLIEMIEKGEKGADTKAYQWAKTLNEIIKVKKEQIKLREMEGKTLDINEVEKWVYNASRQNKEFWLNWCQIVSVKMAEELSVDNRILNSVLLKYVRSNLERIATLPDGYESETLEGS